MKEKTAMMQLIEFGWQNLDSNPLSIIRFAEKLLEVEKQEVIDAYNSGDFMSGTKERLDYDESEHAYSNAEQYFKHKYSTPDKGK